MSPFLPPHQHYDFGPVYYYTPSLQSNEEIEDAAYYSSLFVHSPMGQYQQIYQHVDPSQLQELPIQLADQVASASCSLPMQEVVKKEEQEEKDIEEPIRSRRSLSLRKRGPAPPAIDTKKHRSRSVKSPVKTITPYRFSACLQCRKRKIKCRPNGDSHRWRSDGTNNGRCATCIGRKKECFWPNLVLGSSKSPSPSESMTSEASGKVEEEDEEEEEEEEKQELKEMASPSLLAQVKEEELEVALEETSLPFVVENYFGIPTPGFGRSVSTPALTLSSSSSSSSSSSLPVSPRTDSSFSSPIGSQSFFFENDEKVTPSHVHSSSSFLDTLQQALQSSQHQILFADKAAI